MMIQKLTKFFSNKWAIIGTLLVFSLPALFKLISPGFYEPHDLHHFADIYQMYRAFSSGQIPPRWGPDYLYNFGYSLFNFYYVMPFYLGALFLRLFGSIQLAFKLVFITCIILGVYGMYLLLREFTGKFASFAGSIIFLYTPYRAVQIYVRGAIGEALSLALTPFIAYALIKVSKSPNKFKLVGITGILGAIFILSHNYMWALTFPWIIILALLFTEKTKIWQSIRSLLLSGILMIGISSYWWLPAIIEQKLVAATTPFPIIDHFPFLKQLIIPSWGYGSSIPGPYDGLSFQLGIVNIIGVLLSVSLVIFFRKKFVDKKLLMISIWGLLSFSIMIFMMNVRSYPIWKIMPFHDFVQFPWRLLSFNAFFSAILIAVSIEVLKKNLKILVGLGLTILSIALTFSYFQPSHTTYKTDNEYLSRFFANRTIQGTKDAISIDYINYSEDYLLLPGTTDKKPDFLPGAKIVSQTAKVENITQINPVFWKAQVNAPKESVVTFESLYFPGWYGTIDGKSAKLNPGKPYGQIEVTVPAGKHTLYFDWLETPLRAYSDWASLASVVIALAFVLVPRRATI